MTTTTAPRAETGTPPPDAAEIAHPRGRILHDTLKVAKRNLIVLYRQPQTLVFSTIQPVMLVLLFNFVFGGALGRLLPPNVDYIDYLLPGIMLQAVAFGTSATAVGAAEDIQKGIIDRFRSLPMARSAVLAGRTLADAIRVAFVTLLMTGVGLLIGYRFNTSWNRALAAFALAVIFGFAMSWITATIGMAVKSSEAAQSAGLIWLFPLSFASSSFVVINTFDPWLNTFASVNPITHFVDALRALTLAGADGVSTGTDVIPTAAPVWLSLGWLVVILVIFAPLAVRLYRRTAS